MIAGLYRDRRVAPDMSASYSGFQSITYKAKHFQVNFEVTHDQSN
jgi:hypothetical protein